MSVTNINTCSIDFRLIYDFTTYYFDKDYMIWCKNAKISARSLRSLVIIYDKFLVPTLPIKALPPNHLTHGTPLINNMWLTTNIIIRCQKIENFGSLAVIYKFTIHIICNTNRSILLYWKNMWLIEQDIEISKNCTVFNAKCEHFRLARNNLWNYASFYSSDQGYISWVLQTEAHVVSNNMW